MDGIKVLLNDIFGEHEESRVIKDSIGKTIVALRLDEDDDALHLEFSDGSKIVIFDDGQSCCESRYMRTDDDLTYFIGSKFTGTSLRDAPDRDEDGGVHEVQFLIVHTDAGDFTMANHNEHNGYYGGFLLKAKKEEST